MVVSVQVFLTGLATDFCVGGTALDALSDRVGIQAVVVTDAVRGVDEVCNKNLISHLFLQIFSN